MLWTTPGGTRSQEVIKTEESIAAKQGSHQKKLGMKLLIQSLWENNMKRPAILDWAGMGGEQPDLYYSETRRLIKKWEYLWGW